jgi:hypothetical protein
VEDIGCMSIKRRRVQALSACQSCLPKLLDSQSQSQVHMSTMRLVPAQVPAELPPCPCLLLLADSCKRLDWLHDRMPVVLRTPEAQQRWLRTDDKDTLG